MSYNQQAPNCFVYAGNPNGNVAGNAGTAGGAPPDLCENSTNGDVYVCTTTGSAGAAVWTLKAAGGSVTGVTAGDSTITIGGTAAAPTVAIALAHANVWDAQQSPTAQALTDAATVSITITQNLWTLTTAASRTIAAPSGGVAGTSYRLVLTTGGFDPVWNAVFRFPYGTVPSGLSGVCVFDFYTPDGMNFYCTGQNVAEA